MHPTRSTLRSPLRPAAAGLLVLVTQAAIAAAQGGSTGAGAGTGLPTFEFSAEEACRRAATVGFPAEDMPSAERRAALEGCDSEALYYAIGTAADPVAARHCAILERESGQEPALGGTALLMVVYANGTGTKQDIPLAVRLACEIDATPEEREARVRRLFAMRGGTDDHFDLCDDVASEALARHCAAHEARLAEATREPRREAALALLPPDARPLLRRLDRAAGAFFDARVRHEVGSDGGARAAFQAGQRAVLEDRHVDWLGLAVRQAAPSVPADVRVEDAAAALEAAYERALAVSPRGVRTTQRAWTRHRAAWLALAARLQGGAFPEDWDVALTLERTRQLEELAGDAPAAR